MGCIGGLLILVVALALGIVPSAAGSERGLTMRVVSFNLFHGGPWSVWGDDVDLDRRLGMVARELRHLDVDIVGLQEASEGRKRGNVAGRLADELGYGHVFAAATARILPFRVADFLIRLIHGFREGPAIVSRFPVLNSAFYDLPRCAGFFNARLLLEAELETPHGPLRVFSTHTAGDACQTRRVAEIVRARRGPLPSLVFGDFNAPPSSDAITVLHEIGDLVDVFAAANPGVPGPTVWQRPGASGPTVTRRVDYVFVGPGTAATGRVVDSRVVLDTPACDDTGRPLWPSDHYGVFATVELVRDPRAPAGATMERGEQPMRRPRLREDH